MKRYVVRVELDEEQGENDMVRGTLEFLDFADLVIILESEDPTIFDIKAPADVPAEETQAWAEKVAEKMGEHGYDASAVVES